MVGKEGFWSTNHANDSNAEALFVSFVLFAGTSFTVSKNGRTRLSIKLNRVLDNPFNRR